MRDGKKKKFIIIFIELLLGFLHVIGIGRNSTEKIYILSTSYFSDLALPFGFYFLLKLSEDKVPQLQKWWMKASLIFLAAALAEIGQYFGLNILGRTFDPIDFAIYAAGVLLAASVDFVFSKIFRFWNIRKSTAK